MQQQTQRTTVKVTAGNTPAATIARMTETVQEHDVEAATGRARYCEPGLERLLRQSKRDIAVCMDAETPRTSLKR